ncbi:MAG: cold shock CspA family protein [Francisellaceae bacterium]|jgi:cold shock CspA family protein
MQTGIIKYYNHIKGFGFIICESTNKEYYIHSSKIKYQLKLMKGDKAEFEPVEENDKLQAINVELIFD